MDVSKTLILLFDNIWNFERGKSEFQKGATSEYYIVIIIQGCFL